MGLLSATTGLISGAVGGIANAFSARQQQKAQMQLQGNNQEWQEHMSNTAHQREIEDLKKAGLNPVLSAGGTGATTPSGGVGQASMADLAGGMTSAMNTAIQAKQAEAQIKNLEANTYKQEKESAKTSTETEILNIEKNYTQASKEALINLQNANTAKAREEKKLIFEETALTNARAFKQKLDNEMTYMDKEKRLAFYEKEVRLYMTQLERDLKSAGIENTEIYQGIDHALSSVGKVFHAGSNTSTTSSSHVSQSKVNIYK